jgi:hypothetical protein
MLDLAKKGIGEIFSLQKAAILEADRNDGPLLADLSSLLR